MKYSPQGNILVDQSGHAKITDFGVSKVIEDFSDVLKLPNPTSSFAGSTRWLAPELIWAMVEDVTPRISVHSDVYAFGAVAMEVRSTCYPTTNLARIANRTLFYTSTGIDGAYPIPTQKARSWSHGRSSGRPEAFPLCFYDLPRRA